MEFARIFRCLGDLQRLRILNLLMQGPLCVCHLMEIMGEDQVKISKQLRYMKELGVVNACREAQWMIYSLAGPPHPLLVGNLRLLQETEGVGLSLSSDNQLRAQVVSRILNGQGSSPTSLLPQWRCC